MALYDPYDLCVHTIADALEEAVKTNVATDDISRVDLVEKYDFSGDPTKTSQTAHHILVRPDRQIGTNRGFFDLSSAIGYGPRTWAYFTEVKVNIFPIRETKDREVVRAIIAQVMMRVMKALHSLQRNTGQTTDDGFWAISRPMDPFIQGAGSIVKDAGRNRAISASQRLIVGFILQYLGG